MSIDVIITGIIGLLTTITSGWVSWFFARRKYDSEVDSQLIKNMKESLDFYKQLSDDNKERLTVVLNQNREILEQNKQLIIQNELLEKEVKSLKKQVDNLTSKFKKDVTNVKKKVQES